MEITCFTALEEHVQLCNTESLAGSRSVDSVSVYIGYRVTACVIAQAEQVWLREAAGSAANLEGE